MQTEGLTSPGSRAPSKSRPAPLANPATVPDILAFFWALVPHAFAGALNWGQVTFTPPAGTTPLRRQPRTTKLRRSPRSRLETGHWQRNLLPSGFPRPQSTAVGHSARAVTPVAPPTDAKRWSPTPRGGRADTTRGGHAPGSTPQVGAMSESVRIKCITFLQPHFLSNNFP